MIELNKARSRVKGKDCVETENELGFTIWGYLVAVSTIIHGFPCAFGDSALKMLRHHIQGAIRMAEA